MMCVTVATYRLQFIPDFDCDAAMAIAPYLADLGVSDRYASPILAPRRRISRRRCCSTNPGRVEPSG